MHYQIDLFDEGQTFAELFLSLFKKWLMISGNSDIKLGNNRNFSGAFYEQITRRRRLSASNLMPPSIAFARK
jgi:hypothetical protein